MLGASCARHCGRRASDRRRRRTCELTITVRAPDAAARARGGRRSRCEECFELLDEYVELELAGESADGRLPGMREHLQGCPACREDHESLREFVRLEDAAPG